MAVVNGTTTVDWQTPAPAAERERRMWVAAMMTLTDEFAELMNNPPPGSDHSWLYDDETGLPV